MAIALLKNKIETFTNQLNNFFQNPNGVVLSLEEAEEITELLFFMNKGFYFGTDSNVPSKFRQLYPTYLLNSQECKTSARILLCSRQKLENDFYNNSKAFNDFFEWHHSRGVHLLAIDKAEVYHILRSIPPDHTDIGIWDDDYIVIFNPKTVNSIQVWFKSHNTLKETQRHVRFFVSLIMDSEIRKLKINNNNLSFETLAQSDKNEIIERLKKLWKIEL